MWVAVVAVDISQFNSGCPGESKLQSITDFDDEELFDTNTNTNTITNTNTHTNTKTKLYMLCIVK